MTSPASNVAMPGEALMPSGMSPTSGRPLPAPSQPSEHKSRKYRRFTDAENELILETHERFKTNSWGSQAEIYNAEARKRGLHDGMNTPAFVAKVKRFKSDQEVDAVRAGDYGPGTRKRWDSKEDAVLRAWDNRVKFDVAYKAFIKHMRATIDRNYYRSPSAVVMRLRALHVREMPVGRPRTKREPGIDEKEEDESLDGSSTPTMQAKDWAGARAWPVRNTVSPEPELQTTDQETQTDTTEHNDACPEVVATRASTASLELVEGKLRWMQTLLTTSSEAMFGKSPLLESYKAVEPLHADVLALIDDALIELRGEEEGGSGSQKSQKEMEDLVQLQPKTLKNIMNEKVAAAEERTRRLQDGFAEERQALEQKITMLQAKCRETEAASTQLQDEVARCQRELKRQQKSTWASHHVDEEPSESKGLREPAEQEPDHLRQGKEDEESTDNRTHKKSNSTEDQTSSPIPLAKFSRLSDDLLARIRPRPSVQQLRLASILSRVET